MAAAQAAAVVGGVAALSGSSSKNAAVSSSRTQIVCSAKPRCMTMQATSSFFGSSLERTTPSRSFNACVGLQPIACASYVNEIAVDNAHVNSATKLEVAPTVEEDIKTLEALTAEPTPEASVSAFMADVANLIKLVDSRDIVELELKHKEYEIVIRKEALPPPPQATFPGPHVMAHTSFPGYAPPPAAAPAPVPAAPEAAPVAAAAPAPPPVKPSHPPMLSPMAGTFYRSPGPGELAFVQVGDKVMKGQVVCIVEAMKLMNEIEADQSGTIVEILAEDGKPISMESPLFSIKP